jgi:hypothetical protein
MKKLGEGTVETSTNLAIRIADDSIKSLSDAVQEIITNSADNYWANDKNKYGHIKIEYSQKEAIVKITDFGTGMSRHKLKKVVETAGDFTADSNTRGVNSRGLKDVSRIGTVEIHTIKDKEYSTYKIDEQRKYTGAYDEVTKEIRNKYNLKGNGTVVILKRGEKQKYKFQFSKFSKFTQSIRNHYSYRGITSIDASEKGSKLEVIDLDNKQSEIIISKDPENSETIEKVIFPVPNYEQYKAKFTIKKSYEPNERKILVMGSQISIHQEDFLEQRLNQNDHLEKYYGFLECEGIDELSREYTKNPSAYDEKNPFSPIDQNRRSGLDRTHPFVKNLIKEPIEILKKIIKDEESKEKENKDKNITKEIEEVSKEFMKFLSDYLEDDEGQNDDGDYIKTFGYKIFPASANLLTNSKKEFTIWILEDHVNNNDILTTNNESLKQYLNINKEIALQKHPKYKHIYVGEFSIEVFSDIAEGKIYINSGSENVGSIKVKIIENEERAFENDFEFEFSNYNINVNETKSIKVYAKSPDIIKDRQIIEIKLNNDNIKLKSNNTIPLVPKKRSNYATAEIKIEGLHLDQSSLITASLGDNQTSAEIKVKIKKPKKGGFEIDWVKSTLGGYRFKWDDSHTKLKITYNHFQMEKYYDEKASKQSENFFVLLGEIISDAFMQKILMSEVEKNPDSYNYSDPEYAMTQMMYEIRSTKKKISKGIHNIVANISPPENKTNE